MLGLHIYYIQTHMYTCRMCTHMHAYTSIHIIHTHAYKHTQYTHMYTHQNTCTHIYTQLIHKHTQNYFIIAVIELLYNQSQTQWFLPGIVTSSSLILDTSPTGPRTRRPVTVPCGPATINSIWAIGSIVHTLTSNTPLYQTEIMFVNYIKQK